MSSLSVPKYEPVVNTLDDLAKSDSLKIIAYKGSVLYNSLMVSSQLSSVRHEGSVQHSSLIVIKWFHESTSDININEQNQLCLTYFLNEKMDYMSS